MKRTYILILVLLFTVLTACENKTTTSLPENSTNYNSVSSNSSKSVSVTSYKNSISVSEKDNQLDSQDSKQEYLPFKNCETDLSLDLSKSFKISLIVALQNTENIYKKYINIDK